MFRIKVPPQIHAGGHTYSIRRVRNLATNDGAEGQSNKYRLWIELEDDRPQTIMAETLFHELAHVAESVFFGKKVDHRYHDAIGELLVQFFQDLDVELDFSELPQVENR